MTHPIIYTIQLTPSEERLTQLLTRDAWNYFSNLISQRELFHIKDIPMMPRRGVFELPNDAELIQYYLDYANSYSEELSTLGWDHEKIQETTESFVNKLQQITGISSGISSSQLGNV